MRACPDCGDTDGLWLGFTVDGWQAVDADLKPTGERGVEWHDAAEDGQCGCQCGWDGFTADLDTLGIDGEPLPHIHAGQLEITASRPDLGEDTPSTKGAGS